MYKLRGKLVVGLFFFFISMGQAYPYAVAYTYDPAVQCTCNLKNRKCIHGCDLRKHAKKSHPCHGHEGHHSDMAKIQKIEKSKGKDSQWISPLCSRQHDQKVLSFQGDPFIPVHLVSSPGALREISFTSNYPALMGTLLACDEEPPKEEEPPQES